MDPRVARTIEQLRTCFGRPTIAILAKSVGLGRSRLEHLFKRDTGRSIREYVTEMRLLAAADRIRSSYDRISEIAWNVGFTDFSNFDHAFRKRFGASPTEYRDSLAASLPNGD